MREQTHAAEHDFELSSDGFSLTTFARLALCLAPLTPAILVPGIFFPFVTTRNIFFRFCVEMSLALLIIVWLRRPFLVKLRGDRVLGWFFVFVVSLGIAAYFGAAPLHSVFGDFERMGGVWAWLHLLVFFALLRTLMRRRHWMLFFGISLAVADFIVLFGLFEYLPERMRNPAFQTTLSHGSLIGNPGLLAPYLVFSLAIALWSFTSAKKLAARFFLGFSAVVMVFGLVGSLNRSAQMGVIVGAGVAAAFTLIFASDRKRLVVEYRVPVLVTIFVLAASLFGLVVLAPENARTLRVKWSTSPLSQTDTSASSRSMQWAAAAAGFRERPLTGFGPENHQVVASRHFDPRIYSLVGGGIFDRTHNAWLELLGTAGIVGAVGMLGLAIAVLSTIRDGFKAGTLSLGETALILGTLTAYAVYLTFWFFDVNSALLCVSLLAFLSHRVRGALPLASAADEIPEKIPRYRILAVSVLALLAAMMYLHEYVPLRTAKDLGTAATRGRFMPRLEAFQRAMNSVAPQTEHTLPLYYRFLRANGNVLANAQRNPVQAEVVDRALQRGMVEADRTIRRSPSDDRAYLDAARFTMLAGAYYRDSRYLQLARKELRQGVAISPVRADSRVLLSTIDLSLGDTTAALAQLDSASRLAPQFTATYPYYAALLLDRQRASAAARVLLAGLRRSSWAGENLYRDVISALVREKKFREAAALELAVLRYIRGPLAGRRARDSAASTPVSPFVGNLAAELPILYIQADEPDSAVSAARAFALLLPAGGPVADSLIFDVVHGKIDKWKSRHSLMESAAESFTGSR